ncbi:hypothetical protein [Sphingosinicella sp.]|uniref:hypothetical protein n=1 Tax=Sphingosinicella sp. TaxID=1917971 RepID=UPI00403811AB
MDRPAKRPQPDFAPVRLRTRRDGWTPDLQRRFVAALSASRNVGTACLSVGKSRQSAYLLYRRADAASFRQAWDKALALLPPSPPPPLPPNPSCEVLAPYRPMRAPSRCFGIGTLRPLMPETASRQVSTYSTLSTSVAVPCCNEQAG